MVLLTILGKQMDSSSDREYKVNIACYNCNHRDSICIPKGVSSEHFLKNKACKNCQVVGKLTQWG